MCHRYLKLLLAVLLLPLVAYAQGFDNLPDPTEKSAEKGEVVVDNTPDSIAKALMSRPSPGTTRVGQNPVMFLIGNSTMRNGTRGDGSNGQWGWGYYFPKYFDARKITVENQALGGFFCCHHVILAMVDSKFATDGPRFMLGCIDCVIFS